MTRTARGGLVVPVGSYEPQFWPETEREWEKRKESLFLSHLNLYAGSPPAYFQVYAGPWAEWARKKLQEIMEVNHEKAASAEGPRSG